MYPVLDFPDLGIRASSHAALVTLGAFVAIAITVSIAVRYERIPAWRSFAAVLAVGILTFAGGRLHFFLANPGEFDSNPGLAYRLGSGFLHAPGALLGAAIGSLVLVPVLRIPLGRFADSVAIAAGPGIALARFGCFLHGCCSGTVCSLPWAVSFPRDSYTFFTQTHAGLLDATDARSLPVHPLQVYFMLSALLASFAAWRIRGKRRFPGEPALVALFLLFLSSTLLEPLRGGYPHRPYWGFLPALSWVAFALTLMSAAALLIGEYAHRKTLTSTRES